MLQKKKFENCDSVQKHAWGYRRDDDITDYQTITEILTTIAQTIRYGILSLQSLYPLRSLTLAL